MATRAQPSALAPTSALAYAYGGPVSLVEGPPKVHPRTASHLACERIRTDTFSFAPAIEPVMLDPPTYESRGAMHAAGAVAAASAQQGLDNLYLLEMLEDDALDTLAGEIKSLAADWVRGGVAWWKAGRNGSTISTQPGKDGRQGSATSQKKPASTSYRWTRSSKPAEVKRKEEEQRNRARDARARTRSTPLAGASAYVVPVPSHPASLEEDSLSPAWSTYPPSSDMAKPLPALPPCAERLAPARPCCANDPIRSFGSGRRHSETGSLRRRRTGSSGDEEESSTGSA